VPLASSHFLLRHFDRLAEAPGGIAKLRALLIQLAVTGTLEGKKSTTQDWTECAIDDCFAPLADGRTLHQGWSPQCEGHPSESEKIWGMLKTTSIQPGEFQSQHNKRLPDSLEPRPHLEVQAGDLLITCAGPRVRCGVACLVRKTRKRLMISGKMYRFRVPSERIDPRYMELFLQSEGVRIAINAMKTGSSESGLNLTHERFRQLPVRYPPLAEQRRIVAKMEELMGLCDALEAAQKEREAVRTRLRTSALHQLASPDSDAKFAGSRRAVASGEGGSSVSFVLQNLPRLASMPEDVVPLRRNLFQLAIQGRLAEQRHSEGTADTLAKELRGKRPKINAEDQPFTLPKNWECIRLDQLGSIIGGGTPSKANSEYWIGDIPWISPKDMKRDYLDGAQLSISETALDESAAKSIPSGSLLFVVRGMILAHSFPVAITRVRSAINQDMKAITFTRPEMAEYVLRCLKGLRENMLSLVQRSSHGTCRLEHTHYASLPIPLPPLAEQRRIVAKVDELMAVLDALEAALTTARTTAERLLAATIARLHAA
jgi:type I restriction enzyme S subunit